MLVLDAIRHVAQQRATETMASFKSDERPVDGDQQCSHEEDRDSPQQSGSPEFLQLLLRWGCLWAEQWDERASECVVVGQMAVQR